MRHKLIPCMFGAGNGGPVILLFTPRAQMLESLTKQLTENDFKIIQAETSYLAGIKTNQFLPEIVVIDVSCDNPKDIELANRIQKTHRTRDISLFFLITTECNDFVERSIRILKQSRENDGGGSIDVMRYPFPVSSFLLKITNMAEQRKQKRMHENEPVEINTLISERLFDRNVTVNRKLQDITSFVNKNWGYPFTVCKALDILDTNAGCTAELAKCISADPAISSAVLKIANTVTFARRYGRITDIREAIIRMGFTEARNLLICLNCIDLFPDVYRDRPFERQGFWLHSLTVGLIAAKLYILSGRPRPEHAFIAGLMHDLGKIPLDNNFTTVFPRLLDHAMSSSCAFHVSETKLMGFNHADLGHYLTTHWNFPPSICMAILNHHAPDRILQITSSNEKYIQESVYVANQYAKAASFGSSCDGVVDAIPSEMLQDLRLKTAPGERFFNQVLNELHQLCSYLNLDLKEGDHFSIDDGVVKYDDGSISQPSMAGCSIAE